MFDKRVGGAGKALLPSLLPMCTWHLISLCNLAALSAFTRGSGRLSLTVCAIRLVSKDPILIRVTFCLCADLTVPLIPKKLRFHGTVSSSSVYSKYYIATLINCCFYLNQMPKFHNF